MPLQPRQSKRRQRAQYHSLAIVLVSAGRIEGATIRSVGSIRRGKREQAMKRRVDFIAVHCADTPNGKPFTIHDIDKWHQERGFSRDPVWRAKYNHSLFAVGYHYVIGVDGSITTGRHPDEIGAHVQGFNSRSIGICMIGRDKYTPRQWEALRGLYGVLRPSYKSAAWLGHRDFSPDKNGDGSITPDEYMKLCPGFSVKKWLEDDMIPQRSSILQQIGA